MEFLIKEIKFLKSRLGFLESKILEVFSSSSKPNDSHNVKNKRSFKVFSSCCESNKLLDTSTIIENSKYNSVIPYISANHQYAFEKEIRKIPSTILDGLLSHREGVGSLGWDRGAAADGGLSKFSGAARRDSCCDSP